METGSVLSSKFRIIGVELGWFTSPEGPENPCRRAVYILSGQLFDATVGERRGIGTWFGYQNVGCNVYICTATVTGLLHQAQPLPRQKTLGQKAHVRQSRSRTKAGCPRPPPDEWIFPSLSSPPPPPRTLLARSSLNARVLLVCHESFPVVVAGRFCPRFSSSGVEEYVRGNQPSAGRDGSVVGTQESQKESRAPRIG